MRPHFPPTADQVALLLVGRGTASGFVTEPQAYQFAWNSLGDGSKTLVWAGLGLAGISLLLNLFGDDDNDEKEKAGGMGFLGRVLPFLGVGLAAYGLTDQQPGRLLDSGFYTGLANQGADLIGTARPFGPPPTAGAEVTVGAKK
jgi:hypothetical protein